MEHTFGKYIVTHTGGDTVIKLNKKADRNKLAMIIAAIVMMGLSLGVAFSMNDDMLIILAIFFCLPFIGLVLNFQRERASILRLLGAELELVTMLKKPKTISVKFFFFTDDFFEQMRTGKEKKMHQITLVIANREKLLHTNISMKNKDDVKEMATYLNNHFAPNTYTVEEQKQIFREKMERDSNNG